MNSLPRPTSSAARHGVRLLALSLGVCLAAPAFAYVLPLRAILDQLHQARESVSASDQVVEGTVTLYGEGGRRKLLAATRSVLSDGRCRLEIVDALDEAIAGAFVVWDGGALRGTDHPTLSPLRALEALACPLSATGGAAPRAFSAQLDRLGVDKRYTGLSRLEGRPAYVIGGRPWETDRPQVWLDKETWVPVRAIARVDGRLADVRMTGYTDPASGEWHPRLIQVYVDGERKASFTAERIDRDVALSDAVLR
jgi:hypothetical protein